MQWFLGDPDSGLLNLEAQQLALATAKKTLGENCFRTATEDDGQETTILQHRQQNLF